MQNESPGYVGSTERANPIIHTNRSLRLEQSDLRPLYAKSSATPLGSNDNRRIKHLATWRTLENIRNLPATIGDGGQGDELPSNSQSTEPPLRRVDGYLRHVVGRVPAAV